MPVCNVYIRAYIGVLDVSIKARKGLEMFLDLRFGFSINNIISQEEGRRAEGPGEAL